MKKKLNVCFIFLLIFTVFSMVAVVQAENEKELDFPVDVTKGNRSILPIDPDFNFDPSIWWKDPFSGSDVDIFTFIDPNIKQAFGEEFSKSLTNLAASVADSSSKISQTMQNTLSYGARPSLLTPSAGAYFALDKNTKKWVEKPYGIGHLFTNRVSTLGKGQLGLGFSYQHTDYRDFYGKDLDEAFDKTGYLTADTDALQNGEGQNLTYNAKMNFNFDEMSIKTDIFVLTAVYGLLEDMDIGFALPFNYLEYEGKLKTTFEQWSNWYVFDPSESIRTKMTKKEQWNAAESGIGDMVLFTKYRLINTTVQDWAPLDAAVQGEVKIPTGDETRYLGTGKTETALRLLLQKDILPDLLDNRVYARGEVGYNYVFDDVEWSAFQWKTALETVLISPSESSKFGLSLDNEIIGQYSLRTSHIVDWAIGLKNKLSNHVQVYAGLKIPLNGNGLRPAYSVIAGVEYDIKVYEP